MEVQLSPASWLNLTDLFVFDGVTFWGPTDYPDIPNDPSDTFVQLDANYAKRLDLLAYDQYGDPQYMWVFLAANKRPNGDPYLLPNQFIPGQVIRVPAFSTVQNILNPNKSAG